MTENIMVMMTAKLTKQPRNSRHRNEDDLRRLEQCHEQSQRVLDAVRKAFRRGFSGRECHRDTKGVRDETRHEEKNQWFS